MMKKSRMMRKIREKSNLRNWRAMKELESGVQRMMMLAMVELYVSENEG